MKKIYIALFTIILLGKLYAEDIYEYKDAKGTIVFTNKPVKNAKKVKLPPISVYSSPMSQKDYAARSYTEPLGVGNKRINSKQELANFGSNETGRRQILNEELSHEKQGLEDATAALAAAKQTMLPSEKNNPEQYKARIQALQDAVTEHQKNIELLSKQLGN